MKRFRNMSMTIKTNEYMKTIDPNFVAQPTAS